MILLEVNRKKTSKEILSLYSPKSITDYNQYTAIISKIPAHLTHGRADMIGGLIGNYSRYGGIGGQNYNANNRVN